MALINDHVNITLRFESKEIRFKALVFNSKVVEVCSCLRVALLNAREIMVMLLNGIQDLVELVLVLLCHVLKVVLEGAGVVGHPLDFEFNLRIDGDCLLVCHHLLMNLVAKFTKLLCELVSLTLGLLQIRLKLNTR